MKTLTSSNHSAFPGRQSVKVHPRISFWKKALWTSMALGAYILIGFVRWGMIEGLDTPWVVRATLDWWSWPIWGRLFQALS